MDEINDSPVPTKLPMSFLMQLTQEELGNMTGLSRETVSRLLTKFRRDGQVQQIDNRMILKHPDQLGARYC
jgi:CRP/FNR family transcriptional regulator, cyclic AMP receptor protein